MDKKDKFNFNDLVPELRQHYIRLYGIVIIGIMLAVSLGIVFHSLNLFLIILLFFLIMGAYISYQVGNCLEGNVMYYEGTCIETKLKNDFDKRALIKRTYILLEYTLNGQKTYFKIYTESPETYKVGNVIGFYSPISNVFAENSDTFVINKYYYIFCKRKQEKSL